jgi:hypothetical protein
MAYKSKFTPKNPNKYVGNHNNIICRSLWERTFCKYLDENTNVIRWSSEELQIPYVSPVDNKVHMYYPDFLFEVKKQNEVETVVVEIKPDKQTKQPEPGKKSKRTFITEVMQYEINKAKWKSATKFCVEHGWKFMIITENNMFKGKNT